MHTTSSCFNGKYLESKALVRLIRHLLTIDTNSDKRSSASLRSVSVAAASWPRNIGISNFFRNS